MAEAEEERRRAERAARARERAERREARQGADPGARPDPTPAPRPEPRRAAKRPAASPSGGLSDAWARRIAAGLLAIGVLVAALAFFDLGPFSDPPTEEELATAAVERFYAAASAGDWEEFCGGLTEFARTQVETNISRLTGAESGDCVASLSMGGNSFEGLEIRIRDVNVVGNEARVETSVKLPDEPPELRSVLLVAEDGEWLVNDPG
ncbi:hypothetical protein HJD18_12860 [Thermoleophilia bacterium SCSIO 60948]|nr:hypothetical protein HJD18_12860 [Thermoleophilia bacterium SCSIO 60948]